MITAKYILEISILQQPQLKPQYQADGVGHYPFHSIQTHPIPISYNLSSLTLEVLYVLYFLQMSQPD